MGCSHSGLFLVENSRLSVLSEMPVADLIE